MATLSAAAAVYQVKGVVLDSISGETVPYAAISPVGTHQRFLTDDNGRFNVKTDRSFNLVEVSAMGYASDTVNLAGLDPNKLTVRLNPAGVALGEVIAKPKKEKYSKKNNPAVEFMRRIRNMADSIDPMRRPYYSYDQYERITLALNNVDFTDQIFKAFPEMVNYIDTSEVSGNPILNMSVKEKSADVHFRSSPRAQKSYVTGITRRGVDQMFDQQSIQVFLEDVLREVDVYGNDITILQNRFVSPLSRIAPDFYKFYLADTIKDRGEELIVLSFAPRSRESFGFTGRFYVPAADTTMFIRRIEMNVPHDINLNFIRHLYINQEFERAPDGSRLKTRDDMTIEMSVLGQGLYARRNTAYANHSFRALDDRMFNQPQEEIMPFAEAQTHAYWEEHRLVPMSRQESEMGYMVTELRRNKLYYWGEKALHALFAGYIGIGNPSKFDYGPLNTTISGNTLEGVRLRVGGLTSAALSPRLFGRGYVAYGTKDHKWKYLAEVEYSFRDKRQHPREFPVHSFAFTSSYDVDQLGQHYMFTSPDNFVLTLKRKPDTQITYRSLNKLTYTLELYNNFSVTASLGHERQIASRFMQFIDGYGNVYSGYGETALSVELRYAPGERYFQTRTKRIPVNLDAPVFVLTHTYAPRGFLGSRFTVNKTELSVQKRFWFSAFGYLDVIARGGHVWSQCPYPNLLIPNANLSYTVQPESFALMNAMEFVNDSYASWDVTYWANGAIFNRIPLLKKLKLREVVAFRGLYGHLSDKNRPNLNNDLYRFPVEGHTQMMSSTPYMEVSAGIDNLFKVLRVDYVWRLTYLNSPGIDRRGLRVALHVTF